MKPRAFASTLLAAFSLLSLVLGGVGVYAVTAYATSRRAKEMAVRVALGARPASILRAAVGQTMSVVACGLLLGTAGAYVGARLMSSALFGVTAADGLTYAAGAIAVAAVALLATWAPARRTLRVDPVTALRIE